MAETELQVILKAMELSEHTLRLTSNCNRYPKKYRFSLVDKMQNKCLCIYESLMEANRTDIKNINVNVWNCRPKRLHIAMRCCFISNYL